MIKIILRIILHISIIVSVSGITHAQSAFSADKSGKYSGLGDIYCSQFVGTDAKNAFLRTSVVIWANGFVSGVDGDLAKYDTNFIVGITALIVTRCAKEPKSDLFSVMNDIFKGYKTKAK